MYPEQKAVLVTAVGAPPGLNTLRFLLEDGLYRLIAADADPLCTGLHQFASAGVERVVLPKATEWEAYLSALTGVINKYNITAIIPCIETEIQLLAENTDFLRTLGVSILLPEAGVLKKAIDKYRSTMLAVSLGIPCPKTFPIESPLEGIDPVLLQKELSRFEKECSFPWIIKPRFGYGMRGVLRVDSIQEAGKAIRSSNAGVFVQEYLPGKAGSMYLVGLLYDWDGKCVRRFASKSFRTLFPEGGPATAGISLYEPVLVEMTERLISGIGKWQGPAAVEWMLDPRDRSFKFIEINARIWGYSSLAAGAGAYFHRWLAMLTLKKDIGPDPGYKQGVVMMRTTYDVLFEKTPLDQI